MINKIDYFLPISFLLTVLISLTFSIVVFAGFYGYGNDYYANYINQNLTWGSWFDKLGYLTATLTIGNINFGVLITSFFLSFSNLLLIRKIFKVANLKSIFFFGIISLISIHSWPIIMSTSNAMRQGLAMSFFFITLSFLLEQNLKKSFFFIFFSIFFHKIGLIFFLVFIFVYLSTKFIFYLSNKYKIYKFEFIKPYLFLFFGFCITLISAAFFYRFYHTGEDHRIIRGDYRLAFLLINITFIIFFTFNFKYLDYYYFLFLYFASFVMIVVLSLGYNWQYERLNMTLIIPYILTTVFYFKKKYSYIIMVLLFSIILFLTILNGMYASLY